MNISFKIEDVAARSFGLTTIEEFTALANGSLTVDTNAPNAKPKLIPMMTARRLSDGCRLAVDAGLELSSRNNLTGVIYSSLSGEIQHNYKVLIACAKDIPCSPTDFSMSVHNAAVGNFTILSKADIPSSSVSASEDSFMQALVDAYIRLDNDKDRILVVDYNVSIPEFFINYSDSDLLDYPIAVGFVLSKGNEVTISSQAKEAVTYDKHQALTLLLNYLNQAKQCTIKSSNQEYQVNFSCK